jgi:parvulin-like peptidyl-prolyl isomerase
VRSAYGFHIIQRLGTRDREINVRHIVIPHQANDDDVARARALAAEVKSKLASGVPFLDLIRSHSDEPAQDGDVGYFTLDGLYPAFRKAIENLQIGEVSDVVQDRQGFHFLQLTERVPPAEYTFEEIAPQIREALSRDKLATQYRTWVDKLRERSYVDIRWTPGGAARGDTGEGSRGDTGGGSRGETGENGDGNAGDKASG